MGCQAYYQLFQSILFIRTLTRESVFQVNNLFLFNQWAKKKHALGVIIIIFLLFENSAFTFDTVFTCYFSNTIKIILYTISKRHLGIYAIITYNILIYIYIVMYNILQVYSYTQHARPRYQTCSFIFSCYPYPHLFVTSGGGRDTASAVPTHTTLTSTGGCDVRIASPRITVDTTWHEGRVAIDAAAGPHQNTSVRGMCRHMGMCSSTRHRRNTSNNESKQ